MVTTEALYEIRTAGQGNTSDTTAEIGSINFNVIFWVNHVFEVIIAILIIFGNCLVLAAIAREKNLQTITNYFVASLAAADLLVGVLGIPCALLGFNGIPSDFYGCLFVNSIIVILTQISVFSLLLIALERFVAIKFPFRYQEKCTGKIVSVFVFVSWMAGIVVGFLPALGWNLSDEYDGNCTFTAVIDMNYMVYFNFLGCILTPLVIMGLIYCYIFHVVRQASRQIESLQVRGKEKLDTREAWSGNRRLSLKKEAKAAMWFAFVLFLFSICWLPIHIQNTITLFTGKTNIPVLIAAVLLSHLNSAINPLLYAFANSRFKAGFLNIFRCRASSSVSDTTEYRLETNSHRTVSRY